MGDNDLLWGFGGLLAGAFLSGQDELFKQYKNDLSGYKYFLTKKKDFERFLEQEAEFDFYKELVVSQLKTLKDLKYGELINDIGNFLPIQILKVLDEAVRTYIYQFYRSSVFNSFSVLEHVLKEKLDKEGRVHAEKLIKEAFEKKIISQKDYNFLQGVRLLRNEITHRIENINEDEAKTAILITFNVLRKLYADDNSVSKIKSK